MASQGKDKEDDMDSKTALQELVQTALEEARRIAREDEARLGRKLTQAEAHELACMVERQLKTALAMR